MENNSIFPNDTSTRLETKRLMNFPNIFLFDQLSAGSSVEKIHNHPRTSRKFNRLITSTRTLLLSPKKPGKSGEKRGKAEENEGKTVGGRKR